MNRDFLRNEYFEWLCFLVCDGGRINRPSYSRLLTHLHNTEFTYIIPNDQNRLSDGLNLRYRYAITNYPDYPHHEILHELDEPCTVLEMMAALALRCEENIMDDPQIGNRTSQWFWGMVVSLGLGNMDNERFDKSFVAHILTRFLQRKYSPEGYGGLFTIKHCTKDLREVEIWYQLCWYLDRII